MRSNTKFFIHLPSGGTLPSPIIHRNSKTKMYYKKNNFFIIINQSKRRRKRKQDCNHSDKISRVTTFTMYINIALPHIIGERMSPHWEVGWNTLYCCKRHMYVMYVYIVVCTVCSAIKNKERTGNLS